MLLKDRDSPPAVWDVNQYDWFVRDWENLSEQIFEDLGRPREDAYREAVEYKRQEIREWCGKILNRLHGTEDKTAPRTILFSLPLEQRL
jgi:hypothetical protein